MEKTLKSTLALTAALSLAVPALAGQALNFDSGSDYMRQLSAAPSAPPSSAVTPAPAPTPAPTPSPAPTPAPAPSSNDKELRAEARDLAAAMLRSYSPSFIKQAVSDLGSMALNTQDSTLQTSIMRSLAKESDRKVFNSGMDALNAMAAVAQANASNDKLMTATIKAMMKRVDSTVVLPSVLFLAQKKGLEGTVSLVASLAAQASPAVQAKTVEMLSAEMKNAKNSMFDKYLLSAIDQIQGGGTNAGGGSSSNASLY